MRRLILEAVQRGVPYDFVMDIPLDAFESFVEDLRALKNEQQEEWIWLNFVTSQGTQKDVKKLCRQFSSPKKADARLMAAQTNSVGRGRNRINRLDTPRKKKKHPKPPKK